MSFSSIFLHEKKDGVPEGRRISREEGKNEKQNDCVPGGPTEKRMPVKTYNLKQEHATKFSRVQSFDRMPAGNLL